MYEEVLNNHITNESDVIKVAIEQYQEKQMKTRAIDAKPDDYLSITQVVDENGSEQDIISTGLLIVDEHQQRVAITDIVSNISDYLAEFIRELRKEQYGDALDHYFRLGRNLNQRDTIAVRRMIDGYLKLMYPNGEFTKEELEEIIQIALEMRRRVKEQLKKLGGMGFYDVNFSYIDLEDIRYIFDLPLQTDKEYKESLIKNIFGSGGKATLSVVDKHGKHYIVSRIYGEQSNVIDENGLDLNIQPSSLFDGIQYFGQKDLSNSADHENGLLEKLVGGKIGKSAEITSCVKELTTSVSQLLDANKIPEQIEECKIKESEVEHKMSIYKEKGVAEKLKKQTGYTTDKAKLDFVKGRIDSAVRELKKCYDNNKDVTLGLQGVESVYNSDIIKKASDILSAIGNEILKIGEAVTQIESNSLEFADVVEMLSKKIDGLSDEFAEIKREIKDDTLDIDGFVKMTEELEKYKENLKQLNERAKSKKQIESAFKKAMRERNDILLEQFNAYKLEIQKINESQNELKITIDFKGDRDNFKSQMKTDFRGSGISEIKYQYLCDTFRDYVELIEDWILCDGMKIKEIISSSEYTKLDKKLQDQYADLLKNQVSNNVEIYYHDKLLRHHSIGQRASALILFILMQSDNDIILIDQPEDDLDNKIIYDEVITAIAKKKQDIQFIFATHNANIPVLGDAERIFVVEYQDTTIDISQGNIDLKSTHKQIVDIMEGGEEAFDKRQLIYTSWK